MPRSLKKEIEKDSKYPYQEPALVSLGEKPKVRGFNLVKGNRQISSVSLV